MQLVCDDRCYIVVNGVKIEDPAIKHDPIKRLWNFEVPATILRESNKVEVFVQNDFQACSSAKGVLYLKGQGFLKKCADSKSEYLFQSCKCGSSNVNVAYAALQLADPSFLSLVGKQSLSDEEKSTLMQGVPKEARQFCVDGKVQDALDIEIIEGAKKSHASAFTDLMKSHDIDILNCCTKDSMIYFDIDSAGCELIMCEKSQNYVGAYTGNRLDELHRKTGTCEKEFYGDAETFKQNTCGIAKESVGFSSNLRSSSESGKVDTSIGHQCSSKPLAVFPVSGDSSFGNDFGAPRVGNPKIATASGRHEGNDILAAEGTPVVAAVGGVVRSAYCNSLGGNAVMIRGDDGLNYYYAHLREIKTTSGAKVSAGTIIGAVGTTIGCHQGSDAAGSGIPGQTVPHLHFGIYYPSSEAVNPFCALKAVQN